MLDVIDAAKLLFVLLGFIASFVGAWIGVRVQIASLIARVDGHETRIGRVEHSVDRAHERVNEFYHERNRRGRT